MRLGDLLIADARRSWRFFSVQLGIAAGAVSGGIIYAAPSLVLEMLRAPSLERAAIAIMLGLGIAVFPWMARILKQGGGDGAGQ